MDPAVARTPAPVSAPITFEDGFGQRRRAVSVANEPLEVLAFRDDLTSVWSFEFALRDRVNRLAAFQSEHYARVRAVERLGKGGATLALLSDYVPGTRLSEILAHAETKLIPIETDVALGLIRQLVSAVALLHKKAPELCHGAIAPERIVITPNGRLVLAEYVLGSAIEQLHYPYEQYWKELRVAMPKTGAGPQFDRRTDITQAGNVALALLVGRPIAVDEYPSRIAEMTNGTWSLSANGAMEPLPPPLREWLSRALQLDPRNPFPSALEAWAELDRVLHYSDPLGEVAALEGFLRRYHAIVGSDPVRSPMAGASSTSPRPASVPRPAPMVAASAPAPEPPPTAQPPIAEPPRPVAAVPPPPSGLEAFSSSLRPAPTLTPDPPQAAVTPTPEPEEEDQEFFPEMPSEEAESDMEKGTAIPRGRLIAAAVLLIALTSGGTLAARKYLMSSGESTAAMGTLAVQTNPAGASVVIDGKQRGTTPLSLALAPGRHVLELVTEGDVRSIPVTITPGGQVSQFIEFPHTPSTLGELQIRTEPAGAQVSVDGRPLGKSPLTAEGLTPGPHTVVLENELGAVTQRVNIDAGTTQSLVVPMAAPRNAPVSGWIALTAPVDVQLYENQRLLGSSATDRIMVPVGRHDLEIVNEALGFRATRVVNVSPGQVANVKLDMPKAPVALNALPWAEAWVDGERIGETPIGSVSLTIGPHEVVFRHPELGERRVVTTVTLASPTKVTVDMRKK
jgi:serine/threonine protein kinase